ncbi:gamma-glutamyltransferase [Natronincola ferrireducens]|uniref:Glutathione hydrolase proenzyme n=1 Tax=Natronincola ferrireducens TaxID=393762 RepID=A0A1G9FRX1_9FIRM|nr:gamma-glutamyltransferase [Natronincola ferrireducens]SDK91161.1 gamma-glutamyltranspeptidase / glutathione hydrolase [Natronincola ferrireducens]
MKLKHKGLTIGLILILIVSVLSGCTSKTKVEVQQQEEVPSTEKVVYNTALHANGENGAVSSGRVEATEVGLEVLKAGGNAIDAAVATSFAIQFFEIESTGIAGGGFMLIHDAKSGEDVVIDMRETAPAATTPDMFLNTDVLDTNGDGEVDYYEANYHPLAIGVPGNVAGLELALNTYGTMSMQEIMDIVCAKAEQGIYVTNKVESAIAECYGYIQNYEASKELLLNDLGLPYVEGDIIYNPDLIETYQKIAKHGSEIFYKGELAQKMVDEIQKQGGILTMEDLVNYEATIIEPSTGTYRGYKIVSSPPPSSGGTHIIQGLNILENFDLKAMGHRSVDEFFLLQEIGKYLYTDRAKYMADTLFVDVPLKGLTSKAYAKSIADKIDLNKADNEVTAGMPADYEAVDTTHLSVIDKDGNMVSYTNTVNNYLGNAMVIPGTGIIMNNELTDFDFSNLDSINAPKPGMRPLSSMSPTFVFTPEGEPLMSLGTPGGYTIFFTVLQNIINVIDHGMDVNTAINIERCSYHPAGAYYGEEFYLYIEPKDDETSIDEKILEELRARGQIVASKHDYYGSTNAVYRDTKGFHAVADRRRDSHAGAY